MLPASQNQCIHLLLIYALEGTPIATLRYFPPPLSKVGRVATGKAFRGMGAGRTMLKGLEALLNGDWLPNEACLMKLEGKSVSEITLHAQGEFHLQNSYYALIIVMSNKTFIAFSPGNTLLSAAGLRRRRGGIHVRT